MLYQFAIGVCVYIISIHDEKVINQFWHLKIKAKRTTPDHIISCGDS